MQYGMFWAANYGVDILCGVCWDGGSGALAGGLRMGVSMAEEQGQSGEVPSGPGKKRARKARKQARVLKVPRISSGRLRSVRSQVLESLERRAAEAEAFEAEAERKFEEAKAEAARQEREQGLAPGTIVVKREVPTPPVAGSRIVDKLYSEPMCAALADDLVEWLWASEDHYIMAEWLVAKGIPRSTVECTLRRDRVFGPAWEYALTVQEARVLRRGLECRADAQVTKLVLISQHKYREQDVSVAAAVTVLPGSVEETERMIETLQAHRAALAGIVEEARRIESAVVNG